jgi:DNA-binding transcriptional ArsR family regulator
VPGVPAHEAEAPRAEAQGAEADESEAQGVAALGFEALGDANRREILRLLSDGGKPVQEIADAMPISRPAVSRHLRLLKDAGLVAERARGTRRIYYLQERGIDAVQEYLQRVWGEAAARFRLLAENTEASSPSGPRTRSQPDSTEGTSG